MFKSEEVNDLEFAGYTFDVFTCESGNLGITIYKPGDTEHSIDIFITPELKVIS